MTFPFRSTHAAPPANLCELLLRDVASLLVTSQLISRSLAALRPECEFSRELAATVDSIVTVSDAGESHLREPLVEAAAILPPVSDPTSSSLITGLFARLPTAAAPGVLAAEIVVNLRLLTQHVELKTRLAAEEALLLGQDRLGRALLSWSAEWRNCGHMLRAATVRARAQAYVADLAETAAPQSA